MKPSDIKKAREITNIISERVKFCVNDCNTFLFAKTNIEAKNYAESSLIGGGNFIVLLASFACLDLLSYINSILDASNKELWNKDEITELGKEKSKLSANFKKIIRLPKENELKNNFSDRLKTFLFQTVNIHNMGIVQIEKLVKIRNKLAHVFNPKYIPIASIPFYGKGDFVSLLVAYKTRPIFALTSDNILGVDSNALTLKLPLLLVYLVEKIENASAEKLEIIIRWLKDN